MDRAVVLCVLLLVALTWLLYRLAVLLEPHSEKPATGSQRSNARMESGTSSNGQSRRKLIHQRLRQ